MHSELQKLEICITNHKERKDIQREAFEKKIENLDEDSAIILMDFKENIKLGKCNREVSSVFYSASQRTFFSVAVILRGKKFKYFDFISEDLTHDASFVIRCLNTLFNLPEWQSLSIKRISFWSDGAKHFRNFELIRYQISLIESRMVQSVDTNYFIEYHGKSYCDSHFSRISRILKTFEQSSSEPIDSTSKLINLLNDKLGNNIGYNGAKRLRLDMSFKLLEVPFFPRVENYETCNFKGLKLYYSFEVVNNTTLFASITHGDIKGKIINVKLLQAKRDKPKKPPKISPQLNLSIQFKDNMWRTELKRSEIQGRQLPNIHPMIIQDVLQTGSAQVQFDPMDIDTTN